MKILKFTIINRLKLDLVIEFSYCDIDSYKYNYLYHKDSFKIYFPSSLHPFTNALGLKIKNIRFRKRYI